MLSVQEALNPHNLDGWYALGGLWISAETPFSQAAHAEFRPRLRGGKGGFGTMLKQEGERMSKKTENENENEFRNAQGQRVATVNLAKAIAKERALAKHAAQDRIDRKRKKAIAALNPKIDVRIDRPKFVIGKKTTNERTKPVCDL